MSIPVLLMIHSLGHGGSERQLAALAGAMDRNRFEPHVASVLGGFRADELRRQGIPLLMLPITSYFTPGILGIASQLRGYIREHGIQLVHTFDYTISLFGVPVARTCRGVTVLSSQRFYMEAVPTKYRRALLLSHRMAHGIVANCEELRRHLTVDYHYPAERTAVCYNGLDTAVFHARDRARLPEVADAEIVIGTVCVLRPEKNLTVLLEAFRKVSNRQARLLIVGSGPEEAMLKAKAGEFGVMDRCRFLPSTADVATAMRSIDIFVHPSLTEGLPNAVMEAMACGCTVLASDVGGGPELIDDGEEGLLFAASDTEMLARHLQRAIADPFLRDRLAAKAAAKMKNEFSIERSAERMQSIYAQFLTKKADQRVSEQVV